MDIEILHLLDGARKAKGLTVVIDVFRAFTLECYLVNAGVKEIYPIASLEDAFALMQQHPEYLSFGEREGAIVPGFDYGNSPSSIYQKDLTGRKVIHTTSAGTQGIEAAYDQSDCVITGSLVNASAIASYIRKKKPNHVSLCCMGWEGKRDTEEDILCAEYIKSLLLDCPIANIEERAIALKELEGKKFFDASKQDRFPEEDFWLSTKVDLFSFVIQCEKEGDLLVNRPIFENVL